VIKAERRRREMQAQLDTIVPRQRSRAWDLVTTHRLRIARTDAEGRFAFTGIAPGRYFLASRLRIAGDEVYWFVPVVLEPNGTRETTLTEGNAGWPFS
jgi:hypothetical protein